MKETVISKYSVLGDDIYYHHTRSEADGGYHTSVPDAHAQYELLYLLEGELSYIIEGESYRVGKGDMIFVSPNEIHTLDVNGNLPYERIVLLFDMEILNVMMKRMGTCLHAFSYGRKNRFHVIDSSTVKNHGLERILSDIIESEDDGYKKINIISSLIRLVVSIDRIISESTPYFKKPDKRDMLVSAVSEYIDRNIEREIRLEDIAKELFVSKSTLCHKFSSVMNLSVGRYITMKKIYRAVLLIKNGASSRSAAEAVGYDNYASFFYNYKRIIGHSPSVQ